MAWHVDCCSEALTVITVGVLVGSLLGVVHGVSCVIVFDVLVLASARSNVSTPLQTFLVFTLNPKP